VDALDDEEQGEMSEDNTEQMTDRTEKSY